MKYKIKNIISFSLISFFLSFSENLNILKASDDTNKVVTNETMWFRLEVNEM